MMTPNERRAIESASRERWLRDERRMWLWLLLMAALGCVGIVLFITGQ
jgi:hypothetical protein